MTDGELLAELFAEEFDLMLNFRRLSPCELDVGAPGTNFIAM